VFAIVNLKWAKNFPDASGKTQSGLADERYEGRVKLQDFSAPPMVEIIGFLPPM
jgi:hypothetical protein